MDANECNHLISTACSGSGKTPDRVLAEVQEALAGFRSAAFEEFQRKGEF
jgi:predicted RNase H-like HicB family nuclease